MAKKVVSALLLLLAVAGTALAINYIYICTGCGLTQQYTTPQTVLKCPQCGHSMRPKMSFEK